MNEILKPIALAEKGVVVTKFQAWITYKYIY
jgi:hypothetical protein